VTFNTVRVDGLVIRTAWDDYHAGPVELLITLDHTPRIVGRGITERSIHRLSLRAMAPQQESMKTLMEMVGSLKVVGEWLDKNQPRASILQNLPCSTHTWRYTSL
jgi:hypothetical protein